MEKTGRNDLCPCGSGKKYKKCCEEKTENPFLPKGTSILVAVLAVLAVGAAATAYFVRANADAPAALAESIPQPATAAPKTPVAQPAVTPPPGKVWSKEHGHWHDMPGAPTLPGLTASTNAGPVSVATSQAPIAMERITPQRGPDGRVAQPAGPVPPGKVWSPEHGHWHNVPGTKPAQVSDVRVGGQPIEQAMKTFQTPLKPAPQPPGPVPAGKVWSVEHGHWHDKAAGTAAKPQEITINPQSSFTPGPQPPGPVPEGKVWSTEHGHWHSLPKP